MENNKDIIRFFQDGRKKQLIFEGVTKEQAKEWCSSPYTKKAGIWFDGFDTHGEHIFRRNAKYTHYFTPSGQE